MRAPFLAALAISSLVLQALVESPAAVQRVVVAEEYTQSG